MLNQYIKSSYYSDNIVFTGNTENPFEIMKDMNIVVSCSISEGFGRTLIEAILLKIPIIYANSSTPKEIYKNYEHGLAYKLYDEINLSDKIIYTTQNIDQTIKRVEKAYSYVNNYFTEEKYSQPIIDALNKINQTTFYREKKYVSNLVLSNNLEKKIRIKQNYLNELLANKSIKKVFFGASSVLEKNFNIRTSDSNRTVFLESSIVILSVKPQNMKEVLEEIKPEASISEKKIIISTKESYFGI